MDFSLERILSYVPSLLSGTLVTIELTLTSLVLASVVGFIVALMRIAPRRPLTVAATIYLEIIRNTPDLVQIYYIFYVLPVIGIVLRPFTAGVIALSLHYGAYLSEVFRAGILSIDKGQWEAATALGMSRTLALRRIILPQAVRRVLPAWGNYFVALFKATALVSAVSLQELLYRAKLIGAYNFRYNELFTMVAIIYLLISYPSARIVRRLERTQVAE
jgi:polar amino acid transport system permease protein